MRWLMILCAVRHCSLLLSTDSLDDATKIHSPQRNNFQDFENGNFIYRTFFYLRMSMKNRHKIVTENNLLPSYAFLERSMGRERFYRGQFDDQRSWMV